MRNKYSSIVIVAAVIGLFTLLNSCEKDYVAPEEAPSRSFVEEFDTVANLYSKGWVFTNNSKVQGAASWQQGQYYLDTKFGTIEGFPAFSYKASGDEYVFAGYENTGSVTGGTISSWMITPAMEMRNGDKFSFYTRTISSALLDGLEIRINTTDNSADVGFDSSSKGKFVTLLGAVNPNFTATGYPETWAKYEFAVAGLSGTLEKRRLAFRYYVRGAGTGAANGGGIAIDKFEFTAQ